MIKQMDEKHMAQLKEFLQTMAGNVIPITLRDDQFTVAMDVDGGKKKCGILCDCNREGGVADMHSYAPLMSGFYRQRHPTV